MPKLMLVEDDNNLREIYEARLQAEGYEIISAKDGEEALVVAKAEKPDLIISDIMMPKISGFEMLDILRNTEGLKDVKVIMLTALGQNDDQQRANRLGADRYLVKSQVTLEDIVKVAHELLGDDKPPAAAAAAATPAPQPVQAPQPAVVAPAPKPAPEPPASAAPPVEPAPAPSPAPEPSATPAAPVAAAPPVEMAPAAPAPASAAPAPVPEPAVTPAPESAAPPTISIPVASDDTAVADAQSTIQEEADVESKVEDFVAGASEEPTLPTGTTPAKAAETPADSTPPTLESEPPAPAAEAEPTPAIKPPDPAAKLSDDKLVADAAEALVNSTEGKPPAPEPEPADEPPAAEAMDTPKKAVQTDGRTKKTIKPLDSGPKKDLDTLLAIEEANEAQVKPVSAPAAIVAADNPKSQPGAMPQNPVIVPPAAAAPAPDPVRAPAPAPPKPAAPPVIKAVANASVPAPEPNDPADPNSIAL